MKTKRDTEKALDKKAIHKILENLKEGDTFIDEDGYKCHVIANFPKEQGGRIVFKYYGKRKQWWHYFIEGYHWFEIRMVEMKGSVIPPMKIKIKK